MSVLDDYRVGLQGGWELSSRGRNPSFGSSDTLLETGRPPGPTTTILLPVPPWSLPLWDW